MNNTVVVGAQWGDEGKAKAIDYLASRADIVVRFQGGANAGHTVMVDGHKYVFHLVPSGVIYPNTFNVVANGVVFDPEQFFAEVDDLTAKGVNLDGRLLVSDQAHLVLPFHKLQDMASEAGKGAGRIGTTGRGIGPAYADKSARRGLRVGELREWDTFEARLRSAIQRKQALLVSYYQAEQTIDTEEIVARYRTFRQRLLPMITDTSRIIYDAAVAGKRVLFEGAQGTFLDIDHGTYPYVTSSNTVAGAVCTGAGIGPSMVQHVVGILKAYTTRVGNGPFPTEQVDGTGEALRTAGHEFGATTGRPRRCGWFDAVLARKSVELNGMTRLALTKLDVLNGFAVVRICTHYRIGGQLTDRYPSDPGLLAAAEPVYEEMAGWQCDISGARRLEDLPCEARAYIARIQELCHHVPLLMVSVGPDRSQTIEVQPV